MQNKKYIFIIRIISIVTAATAFLYNILPPTEIIVNIWWKFTFLLQGQTCPEISWRYLLYSIFPDIFFVLLIVLKIVSAYGLFRFRSWAINLAIVVLLADFITRLLYLIIMFWPYWSYWLFPLYILALISLISAIFLLQKPVRKVFRKVAISKSEKNFA